MASCSDRLWNKESLDVFDLSIMIHRFIQNTRIDKASEQQMLKLKDATRCLCRVLGIIEDVQMVKCQDCDAEIEWVRFCPFCGTEQDDYPYDEEE